MIDEGVCEFCDNEGLVITVENDGKAGKLCRKCIEWAFQYEEGNHE